MGWCFVLHFYGYLCYVRLGVAVFSWVLVLSAGAGVLRWVSVRYISGRCCMRFVYCFGVRLVVYDALRIACLRLMCE